MTSENSGDNRKIASHLIRLGSEHTDLRSHIRPILASLINQRAASDKHLAAAIKSGQRAERLLAQTMRGAGSNELRTLSQAMRRLTGAVGMLQFSKAGDLDIKKALSWVEMAEAILVDFEKMDLTKDAAFNAYHAYEAVKTTASILHEDVLGLGRKRR